MRNHRRTIARVQVGVLVGALLSAAVACSSSTVTGGGGGSTEPVERAQTRFCDDLSDVVQIVDRYGKAFSDAPATVGQLRSDATALQTETSKLTKSADALAQAIQGANTTATAKPGATATTTTLLSVKTARGHLDDIDAATAAVQKTIAGVNDSTTVRDAAVELQIAAFGLEQAYVALFVDAGCLADDAKALNTVRTYVTGLQQDLSTLGYYSGPVDGLYGSATVTAVRALQASANLPQTGVVDPATEKAMATQLAAKGKQDSLNVAALQGALTAEGVYTGPIDGVWSDAVEAALQEYQRQQSLPPTGKIDPETLAALLGSKAPPATEAPTTTAATAVTTTTKPAAASTTTAKP